MNIVLLVGRLVKDCEVRETNGHIFAYITVAVRRDFKNSDGEFETDFVPVTLWEGSALYCRDYCKKGTMISVTARVQINKRVVNGETKNSTELVGEMITFIANPQQTKEGE